MLGHQRGWHPKVVDERFASAGLPHRWKSRHGEELDSPREPLRAPLALAEWCKPSKILIDIVLDS
jgi:hypothetical protein